MAEIWPTPHDWSGADPLTNARMNEFRDALKFLHNQGANLTAAATISPTNEFHKVTGNTQISSITAGSAGSRFMAWFTGTPLLKHGTGNIQLGGGFDYQVAANDILEFRCDGTNWYQAPSAVPGGPRSELDFVSTTTSVTGLTSTNSAAPDTVITGTSKAYDGTKRWIKFFCPGFINTGAGNNSINLEFSRGAVIVGIVNYFSGAVGAATEIDVEIADRAPTAGTYSYVVKTYSTGAQTVDFRCGAGGAAATRVPMHIAVFKG